jgi:hypothetical protein
MRYNYAAVTNVIRKIIKLVTKHQDPLFRISGQSYSLLHLITARTQITRMIREVKYNAR